MTTRTRTHSALKWLANERAGALGELEAVRSQVTALMAHEQRIATQLESLDETIRRFDPDLKPESIRAVRGRTQGSRGSVKSFFLEQLRLAGPCGTTTAASGRLLAAETGDPIPPGLAWKRFVSDRVSARLRDLKRQGLAVNLGDLDRSRRCRWVLAEYLSPATTRGTKPSA